MKLVNTGLPLPLGSITNNLRSIVSLTNLIDLVVTCINHPNAKNQIFLVSDEQPLSTKSFVSTLLRSLSKQSHLIRCPLWVLYAFAKLFNKKESLKRLTGSFEVDMSKTKKLLNWHPPQSTKEGFIQTTKYFLENVK